MSEFWILVWFWASEGIAISRSWSSEIKDLLLQGTEHLLRGVDHSPLPLSSTFIDFGGRWWCLASCRIGHCSRHDLKYGLFYLQVKTFNGTMRFLCGHYYLFTFFYCILCIFYRPLLKMIKIMQIYSVLSHISITVTLVFTCFVTSTCV